MRILLFILPILFSIQFVSAQPTQAEIDKMIKKAKAEIDKLKKDPKNAEMVKNMPDMDSVKKLMPKGDNAKALQNIKKETNKNNDTAQFVLPARNEKYLNALPIRTFTKGELVSYLHNLDLKLSELISVSYGIDIKDFPEAAFVTTGSSIALWINDDPEKSALVSLKGAELNPDNPTLLNNAGGILTDCGLAVNAIPILQYVLEKQPANNMILNNLGQAYFSLGDYKTAEKYLLKCISSYNYYPDANLALAYIYKSQGNKSSALKYAENSLRGGWSEGAYNLVDALKPDANLIDYVRHRYKQPEYFNFNKYPLLPQCRDTKSTLILKPRYAAFKEMLRAVKEKYDNLRWQEEKIAKKTVPEKMMTAVKANKSPYRPFGIFGTVMITDLSVHEYYDRLLRFAEYKKNYVAQREKFTIDYTAEINAINESYKLQKEEVAERDGEGTDGKEYEALIAKICAEKEVVKNRYLNLFADVIEAYQQKAIHLYKDYFNDMAFWGYVASIDDHQYKAQFYRMASSFIEILAEINTTHFYTPCLGKETTAEKVKEIEIELADCFIPGKFELPLGILKLELSCESYKLEAGEGIVGKIEYNRVSGDFTLALGVGAAVPRVLYTAGGVEFRGEGEAKSQLYITFDKHLAPTDAGILWEAELKLAAGMGEGKYSIGVEEGLTAGFGSGVQMREGGQLKAFIDKTFYVQPDAAQINKNVPLYRH